MFVRLSALYSHWANNVTHRFTLFPPTAREMSEEQAVEQPSEQRGEHYYAAAMYLIKFNYSSAERSEIRLSSSRFEPIGSH